MEEKEWNSNDFFWIVGLTILAGMLLLSRGMVWLIPTIIIPGLIILALVFVWKRKSNEVANPDANDELTKLADNCQNELKQLKLKAKVIANSQNELQEKLDQNSPSMDATLWKETNKLLGAYTEQEKLILAKQEFYEEMSQRISALMENHKWKLALKRKQRELEKLKGDHYEDVERMELLKQDLAYSTGFFDAIKELSAGIAESTSTGDVSQLKQELKKLFPN